MPSVWTAIATGDYESHMAAIGQAQAAAELTRWLVESAALRPQARIVIAGAGAGQMLDFLPAETLRPYRLTFSDLNPAPLVRLRARLAAHQLTAHTVADDIERTALAPHADLLMASLLLEHIDWRRGVAALAALRPASCGIVLQENPPGMSTAVTPGRQLPPSMARAMQAAPPVLIPREPLVAAFAQCHYRLQACDFREVSDHKRLAALLFAGRYELQSPQE